MPDDSKVKIMNNIDLTYHSVPEYVLQDERLDKYDLLVLLVIFMRRDIRNIKITQKKLASLCRVSRKTITRRITKLVDLNWIQKKEGYSQYKLTIPETVKVSVNSKRKKDEYLNEEKEKQKMIDYFNKFLYAITPTDFRKIQTYIEDGMTYNCISEIIKHSARYAKSNVKSYFFKVLNNCFNEGIRSKEDFTESVAEFNKKREEEGNGANQFSKNGRENEKGKKKGKAGKETYEEKMRKHGYR